MLENCAVYEVMWKEKHKECIAAFPLQHWIRECFSVSLSNYTVLLVLALQIDYSVSNRLLLLLLFPRLNLVDMIELAS